MSHTNDTLEIAAAGLAAQRARMRVISENIANAQSVSSEPGGDPYRRQVPVFDAELDKYTGLNLVQMNEVHEDQSDFQLRYEPGHPAADLEGYVKYPNVQTLVEMMDMREAMRTYEANLNMIDNTRRMMERTLDLLRR